MAASYVERLEERVSSGMSPACVGIDPRPERLPAGVAPGRSAAERIVAFVREVLPSIARRAPVVKPNIAFFEALGADGWRAYEEVCRLARAGGLLVIGDVKRGDIGSTAAAYARAHFAHADALTVNPYLGTDAIEPFLAACREAGRAIYVLVRTSNPGAAMFQSLRDTRGHTVAEVVARAVDRWGEDTASPGGFASVGAVVGATRADELLALRRAMPRAPLLIPGVGAQGGRITDLRAAFDGRGFGAVVNQSRAMLECFEPGDPDWRDRIDAALDAFHAELQDLLRDRAATTANPHP
ncbi:MAG: orotidine-5'-phosphate decarboxylase [Planctomycetes bacterium]|nr:orotidine-5'-phosphate decarboxylase [Planctomycetota bacterium]